MSQLPQPASGGAQVQFDFIEIAEEIRKSWVALCYGIQPLVALNAAVKDLSKVLPKYIDDNAGDDLLFAMAALLKAQDDMVDGIKVAAAANRRIGDCFDQMAAGLQALRQIHEIADSTGFGKA
jgi:hypothetical protein